MMLIILVITITYLLLIGSFIIGFDKIKPFSAIDITPKTKFSIVIPFKNEAENLPQLLDSLSKLNYPKHLFEIILVNDNSDDSSESIVKQFLSYTELDIKLVDNIRKTTSPKKDAIQKAISLAKFDWIVTSDADCVTSRFWLESFDGFIQSNNCKFIVAPVTYNNINSFLKRFQVLDILSLQGATIGGFGIKTPFLCNGANLAYEKTLFNDLNGFEGNTNIASGDDIFMLEKAVIHAPEFVHYLKSENAIIKTKPQPDLKSLISQRIRWAAKTSRYKNWFGKLTGFIVLLINALIVCGLIFSISGIISIALLGIVFILKFLFDLILIQKSAAFFGQKHYLSNYFICSFIYPFFSVYVAVASFFMGYKWKGINYNK